MAADKKQISSGGLILRPLSADYVLIIAYERFDCQGVANP